MFDRGKFSGAVRYLLRHRAMVFLHGPRQAGKTTLAGQIVARDFEDVLYLDYEDPGIRTRIREDPHFFASMKRKRRARPLVIFDEIHKYRDWKNYLKGVFDVHHSRFRFLVAGSGRLDLYRRGGDSLAGRYFQVHLFPLTVAEISNPGLRPPPLGRSFDIEAPGKDRKILEQLLRFSGFPEPLAKGTGRYKAIWSRNYHERLVLEDVRDALMVREIDALKTLYALLPSRVGSPLSINRLARLLQVHHRTVSTWISAFENLYLCFRVPPWHRNVARSVRKERKLYLMDPTRIEEDGPRIENLAALELLRAVTFWSDLGYGAYSLHYVRTREGEEADFLVCRDGRPRCLFEVKVSDDIPSRTLLKIQGMLGVPAVLLVKEIDHFREFRRRGAPPVLAVPMASYFARL